MSVTTRAGDAGPESTNVSNAAVNSQSISTNVSVVDSMFADVVDSTAFELNWCPISGHSISMISELHSDIRLHTVVQYVRTYRDRRGYHFTVCSDITWNDKLFLYIMTTSASCYVLFAMNFGFYLNQNQQFIEGHPFHQSMTNYSPQIWNILVYQ